MKPKNKPPQSLTLEDLNKEAEASLQELTQEIFVTPLLAPINSVIKGQKDLENRVTATLEPLEDRQSHVEKIVKALSETIHDQVTNQEKAFSDLRIEMLGNHSELEGKIDQIMTSVKDGQEVVEKNMETLYGAIQSQGSYQEKAFTECRGELLGKQSELEGKIEKVMASMKDGHGKIEMDVKSLSKIVQEQWTLNEKVILRKQVDIWRAIALLMGLICVIILIMVNYLH